MTLFPIDDAPNRSLEALRVRAMAAGAGRVVFVSGNFNIVHPGHLRLLKFAADVGDFLVVAITPDGRPNVTVPAKLRQEALQAISIVNCAVVLDAPVEAFLDTLRPHFVVKGKEYQERFNAEQAVLDGYGGQLLFSSGEVRFSSLDLLHREYDNTAHAATKCQTDYLARHGFGIGDLRKALQSIRGLRVLVIGDLIMDEYISCDPLGMSQEDPTIVVTPIENALFVGGAGIVAGHAKGLGADVRFVTLVGQDERAALARQRLALMGVETEAFEDGTRPTTLKQRFRALGKTLLRVNHLRQHAMAPPVAARMLAFVEARLPSTDLVLFADFNYGCLPQPVVDAICASANRLGVMTAADSQASSQLSDISRYKGTALVTPTEREARLALQDTDSGLVIVAEKLQRVSKAENVIVTLGAEGILLHGRSGDQHVTDRLPALNTAPKDVAGAGDSLFTTTSMALRAGTDIWCSAYLGSLAAACQVSRVGNTPLTVQELQTEIDGQQVAGRALMRALLLAAGMGTRLLPVTRTVPKCLVPIAGRPLLDIWLDLLFGAGVESVLVNTSYLAETVQAHVDSSPWRARVVVAHEESLLGTGGTVLANRDFLGGSAFMVIHADNLTDFDVAGLVAAHRGRPAGCAITMLAFRTDRPELCGILELDEAGIVRQFHEKVADPPGNLANGAVYVFEPEVIDFIASLGREVADLSTEVMPAFLGRILAVEHPGYHRDIGNLPSLEQAWADVAAGRVRLPGGEKGRLPVP